MTTRKTKASKNKKSTNDDFKKKLKNHQQISKSAPGTAFENYSTNKIRKEIGRKPKLMKGTKMPKPGPYTPGKGIKRK